MCHSCARCCDLATQPGFCGGYHLRDGKLFNVAWGAVETWGVDPIEKKPVYHFRPGSRVLSLGTRGCTFRCQYCLNHDLAWARPQASPKRRWTPQEVVALAQEQNCAGLAWTFNEAALWLPFVIACNQLARAQGLYTVLVTNGAYGPRALEALLPTLDVWRVDIKAWDDETYRNLLGAPIPARVVREATETATRAGLHVEVVTCLVPGHHDHWEAVAPVAQWIRDALGSTTPWHLIGFHPQGALRKLASFPRETAAHHRDAARAIGLQHVYLGGDGLDPTEATGPVRHYEWRGPRGEFLRLTVDRNTGAVGYIGDEALLHEVMARCQAEGLNLHVQTQSRCG